MQRIKKLLKRFGTDIAGYCLIIAGLLTGWLPGPGGIPLILAGLGLLSMHNPWARSILHFIKQHGKKFVHYIFPENPYIKALHDFFAITLVISAIILISTKITALTIGLSISLVAIGVADFLYNRKRWHRFKNKYRW